jgi:penicillin-binding protein 1A
MIKYILGFFAFIGIAVLAWLIFLYSEIRFDINKVVDYKPPLTTQFYDQKGELVANIFDKEHRLYVEYEDIPPRIVEALVAIEDTQFFEHNGINLDAISRAIIKDIKAGALVEGASTLTQQLVKTLVLSREKKLIRKVKEALLSIRLETILTKEEILERYLNQVYFGHGYYGIKTAALGYFKKELYELNLKEIAILVGLPRAPSFYDPTRNLKYALARANQVINRMNTLGWINQDEYERSLNLIPDVYSQTLTQNKAPYVIDYALKELKKNIPDLKSQGFKVNLTIDLKAQQIAREALNHSHAKILKRDEYFRKTELKKLLREKNIEEPTQEDLDYQDSFTATLNGGLISIENKTGKIISLVGGIDYKTSSFNRVIQSKRQVGSAVKPFIYQQALNLGYSPASTLIDISRTYEYEDPNAKVINQETGEEEKKKWQPKNYEENYKGLLTLKEALVHSRNLATINLVNDIGIDVIYKGLKRFGIKEMPFDLSITLGSFGISPLDLSQSFSMFSNGGVQVKPYIISSIRNRFKDTIVFEPTQQYIMDEAQAFLTTNMLHETVINGTGRMAKVKGIDIAGKTGTSNKNVDAWFCGYSPTVQTIVWFGNDNNKPMRKSETGGRAAGPAFAYFYKNYLKIHPELPRKFSVPKNVKTSLINGKKEYFTDISKLPEKKLQSQEEGQQIQF